jgi:hypothetical protein
MKDLARIGLILWNFVGLGCFDRYKIIDTKDMSAKVGVKLAHECCRLKQIA